MVSPSNNLITPRWKTLRPHPTQFALWNSPARYNIAEAGRRSGKSELAKRKGTFLALTHHARSSFPDGHYKFGAPTRDQAKHIYWEDVQLLLPSRYIAKVSESELWVQLINGARIYIVGLDAVKRIEGQPMDWFAGDEAQEWKRNTWDRTIWPALQTDGRNGGAWVYGVTRDGAEFEELAKRARLGGPDWAYFRWRSEDILGAQALADARAKMDPRTYEIEFGAQRISTSGRAYYTWSREVHASEPVRHRYHPRAPLEVSLDFNVEPGVAALSQRYQFRSDQDPRDDRPEVADVIDGFIGEVWIPVDSNTHRVCRKIIEDWGQHQGLVIVYGDPAGGQRRSSADGSTDWTIVREVLGHHFGHDRVQLRVRRSHPEVRARVNCMNSRLLNVAGIVSTLVDQDWCPHLCEDFDGTLVLPGSAGEINKKKDLTKTHMTDGVSYRAEYLYSGEGEVSDVDLN